MYRYDEFDERFVNERVAQFRRQVKRRIEGELTEDQFRPLRLMNGLYLQLHAYMLRINVPYGTLSSKQMRKFAYIARTYDKNFGHFTTRQNIQYNWIKLEDTPDILQHLADVEVTGIQSSGNCVRNITSDQYAGRAKDELADPRVYCELLRQYSFLHPEFSYLPRKFKIAVTGSPNDRAAVAVHDIGLRMHKNEQGEIGFEVLVGGGLGRTPYIGHTIRKWLAPEHLLSYVESILRVYNMQGRRDNIHKARIKIIVNQMGIDKYRELVDKEWELTKDGALKVPDEEVARINAYFAPPQYEQLDGPDRSARQAARRRPRVRALDARQRRRAQGAGLRDRQPVAEGARQGARRHHGRQDGRRRRSRRPLQPRRDPREPPAESRARRRQAVRAATSCGTSSTALELATPNLGLLSDIICCPGLDYCALANARSIPIAQDISRAFTDLDELQKIGQFTINISGCMNACGHHHVGHIGILGVDKRGQEFFQLTLGGSSDQHASLGDRLGPGLPQAEVPAAIRKIVDAYLVIRQQNERFLDTYRRVGIEPFKSCRLRRRKPGGLMALIKNGELVTSSFVDASAAEAIPPAGPVIVSLQQWKAHRDDLLARGTPLGIRLHSDQSPELIAADVPHFALVALEFPKFRDGRAYSYARLLRERYGFKGELRAVGEVLLEQLFFMLRTGFDAFELQSADPLERLPHGARGFLGVVSADGGRPADGDAATPHEALDRANPCPSSSHKLVTSGFIE